MIYARSGVGDRIPFYCDPVKLSHGSIETRRGRLSHVNINGMISVSADVTHFVFCGSVKYVRTVRKRLVVRSARLSGVGIRVIMNKISSRRVKAGPLIRDSRPDHCRAVVIYPVGTGSVNSVIRRGRSRSAVVHTKTG